jgi:hypothetical protein
MRGKITIGLLSLLIHAGLHAQGIQTFSMSAGTSSLPPSNSINVLVTSRDTMWVGTSRGVTYTTDGSFWQNQPENPGISAIAINDKIVWSAVGYAVNKDGDFIDTGGGLDWSSDRGMTWNHVPQPVDQGTVDTLTYGMNQIPTLAITVPQQNITYDIALTSSAVWIASFAGMLRKSTDLGQTWERVVLPPDNLNSISPNDTLDFDLSPAGGNLGLQENLNHRVFSVYASSDSVIWVGTAGGINRSSDGGLSWRKFSHQNQTSPISGNFVVAINEQVVPGRRILWASTVNAADTDEEEGVSFSADSGNTWKTTLLDERTHNISFQDSIVYVASDRGVFRSSDMGESWLRNGTIIDPTNGQRFTSQAIYAVATRGDTVWVGGSDGIAFTLDSPVEPFGTTWHVLRTYKPVGVSSTTYSFPLPFSPDEEPVRIHYGTKGKTLPVTIKIFDFGMIPVRTLIQNAVRTGTVDHDEVWDGTTDRGVRVTNGVYFYRIELGGETEWGKIMVLQ